MSRTCCRCGQAKPATREFFYPDNRRDPPLQGACKACALTTKRAKNGERPREVAERELQAARDAPTKTCGACGREKPNTVEFFYRWPRRPESLKPTCKACEAVARRAPRRRGQNAAVARKDANKPRRARAMAKWRAAHPLQAKAASAVAYALRKGRIVRNPCKVCGGSPAQAHHHKGYEESHWLDVEWLCRGCHMAEHHPLPPG